MCSVMRRSKFLAFFQFDENKPFHKYTRTNIYEYKKKSNYCFSVSQRKKRKKIGRKWALFIKCDCP